jgi:hypothetical protein
VTRYLAVHTSGVTVEVLAVHGPSGGWPEIRATGDPTSIVLLHEIVYEDDEDYSDIVAGDYPVEGEPQDSFEFPFVSVPERYTPASVLEQVVNWLDEVLTGPFGVVTG